MSNLQVFFEVLIEVSLAPEPSHEFGRMVQLGSWVAIDVRILFLLLHFSTTAKFVLVFTNLIIVFNFYSGPILSQN